ncbi:MAG: alpha-glucosidase [Candidatus Thorarchaeota archaeon]
MPTQTSQDLPWWKKTTVYQIYPRSFKDSTNNGIGDIPGIISKLDYLQDLGIETIWFSPFFSSPQADHGYDVSDYRDVAPEYGTMADCERLIQEMHNRRMYVVFDLVLNHTSDQHKWFLESRSSRDNPKRDWYIWRDGAKSGGRKPPNNWNAMVGGSGWHYDEVTDQWYWAQFLPFQPDLNHRNPEVKKEMFDTVRFWLEKGVDGFRLDIINTVYEDENLRNNPRSWNYFPSEEDDKSFFQDNIHTINHPDNFTFVKELRCVMDEFSNPERFLVGEITASLEVLKRYCGEVVDETKTDGLHLTFQFQSLNANLDADTFRGLIDGYEHYLPEPYTPTLVFSNHDQARRISKLGNDMDKAKLNALLQLTARGVPFIYYGEEIGMFSNKLPLKNAQDPIAHKFGWLPQFLVNFLTRSGSFTLNRDECRTPMQWDTTPNAGFCQAGVVTWLPVEPRYEQSNIEVEERDPESILNCYKNLLRLRRNTPALHSGSIHLREPDMQQKDLLVYERRYLNYGFNQTVEIWLNFSSRPIHVTEEHDRRALLFSTTKSPEPIQEGMVHLEPYQGIIVERQAEKQ